MAGHLTIKDILALWPTRAELAADISDAADPVTVDLIHKWPQRGSIPPRYHARILRAADRRGYPLTAEQIVKAHDRSPGAAYGQEGRVA